MKPRAFTFTVDEDESKTCQIIAETHADAQEKAHDLLAQVARAQGREEQRHKLRLVSCRRASSEEIQIGNVVNSVGPRLVKIDLSTIPVPVAMTIGWRKGVVRLMGEERAVGIKGEELLQKLVDADEQELKVTVLCLNPKAKGRVEDYMGFVYAEQLAVRARQRQDMWPIG